MGLRCESSSLELVSYLAETFFASNVHIRALTLIAIFVRMPPGNYLESQRFENISTSVNVRTSHIVWRLQFP